MDDNDVSLRIGADSDPLDTGLKKSVASVVGFSDKAKSAINSTVPSVNALYARIDALTTAVEKTNQSVLSSQRQFDGLKTSIAAASAAAEIHQRRVESVTQAIQANTERLKQNSDSWMFWTTLAVAASAVAAAYEGVIEGSRQAAAALNAVQSASEAAGTAIHNAPATAAIYATYAFNSLASANLKAGSVLNEINTAATEAGASINIYAQYLLSNSKSLAEFKRQLDFVTAGLSTVTAASVIAAGGFDKLRAAAGEAGFKTDTGYLDEMGKKLLAIPGMTNETAAGIVKSMVSVQNYSVKTNDVILAFVANMAKTEDEAKKMASALAGAYSDPAGAGAMYIASLAGATDEIKKQYEAGKRLQDDATMRSAIMAAQIETYKLSVQAATSETDRWMEAIASRESGNAFDRLLAYLKKWQLSDQIKQADQVKSNMVGVLVETGKVVSEIDKIKLSKAAIEAADFKNELAAVVKAFNPILSQIDELNAKMATLAKSPNVWAGALAPVATDTASLIAKLEIFRSQAYWDEDKQDQSKSAWAIGYGSHTVNGKAVQQGDTIDQAGAQKQLADDIVRFQTEAAKSIGEAWSAISERAKMAITSVTYNYGHVPDSVIAAAKTGNDAAIAQAIGALGKGTVNEGRRHQEAAFVSGGQSPEAQAYGDARVKMQGLQDQQNGGSPVQIAQRKADLMDDEVEKQKTLNSALQIEYDRSVGTAREAEKKAALDKGIYDLSTKQTAARKAAADAAIIEESSRSRIANLDADLIGKKDTIGKDKKEIASLKTQLGLAGEDPDQQRTINEQLKAAELKLKDDEAAIAKASAELKAAAFESGSKESIAILNRQLAAEAAGYVKGSAEELRIRKEISDNNDRLAKADAQQKASLVEVAYINESNKLREQSNAIREAAAEHQISRQQENAELATILDAQTALNRKHQKDLQDIWGEGTAQYRQAATQLLEIDQSMALQRQKIDRDTNKAVYADYRSTFEGIGQNVSGSVMGMIKGTTTFYSAAQSIASQLLSTFISARIKSVADWMAGQATQLATTVSTQAGQTAAVTAGTTARTAAVVSGAAAGVAAEKVSNAATVSGDAAKAAAGAYASVVQIPIIGPLLAPPAAAVAYAAVSAFGGGFAQGSWELPSTGLILAHENEMIVPAAQTPWAQDVLASAMNKGGESGGGDRHVHAHFNVQAMDAGGVRSWMTGNSKHIMGALNDMVRRGDHLGMRKLTGA